MLISSWKDGKVKKKNWVVAYRLAGRGSLRNLHGESPQSPSSAESRLQTMLSLPKSFVTAKEWCPRLALSYVPRPRPSVCLDRMGRSSRVSSMALCSRLELEQLRSAEDMATGTLVHDAATIHRVA